ncbi:MAG: FAD-dependent oxidoreductase, partial [Proteobacteria bacterium]|nr:FAD-dependent oxidoreductase [Pseudomonadota bacterium]MBU4389381.1 FAD-dependent oxidoreductase [Pseudomonadota bacterium]
DTSILQAAEESGIKIPTLCYQEHLKPLGRCRLCVVEIEGKDRLVTSCIAKVKEGMVVDTDSERVRQARQNKIELILTNHYGDCVAPCHLACPANVDIQGYLALLANGQYLEALKLVKERCPMPLVIGRICPHPCETECRRQRVDEPVCINFAKRFLGDYERTNYKKLIVCLPEPSGYRVAVVGGGPAGLSTAFYLRQMGHEVTIFEAMPELGGQLKYGIPSYRLPRHILELEIESILQLGIDAKTNTSLGKDFTCASLLSDGYSAVFLGLGCWGARNLRIPGEELSDVIEGTTFLTDVSLGKDVKIGNKVIVIGGGNTAIDAARTALRLGAKNVAIYYRRSRVEMPALAAEVDAAEEEGVQINILVAPSRLIGENGKLKQMEYISMTLCEKDDSGRCRPAPISGSEKTVDVDTVIAAIGQVPEMSCLQNDEIGQKCETTRWGTIVAHPGTLQTNVVGVFTGGDVFTGPKTVVSAFSAGRRAAHSIDLFLRKKPVKSPEMPFNISKGSLNKVDSQNFVGVAKKARATMPELPAGARRNNFEEVDLGFSEETAVQEAKRCLSCGCIDAFECKLREYATEYGVDISNLESRQEKKFEIDETHPHIIVDPNKCINCRRCMRNCSEYQCSDAIELEPLEFDQKGKATFFGPVINDNCVSCGLCVSNCPTGALIEKTKKRPGPFHLETTPTTCSVCGCGCNLILNYIGNDLVKVTSDLKKEPNYGHLCINGKFRYKDTSGRKRLNKPLIKQKGQFISVEWDEAISHVVQRLKTLQKTYPPESFAGIATPACTNEEAYLFQKFLRAVLKTSNIDFFDSPSEINILPEFTSLFSTTAEYRTIETAKQILITSDNPAVQYPVIDALVRRAQRENKATIDFVDGALPEISDEMPTVFLYSKEIFKWDTNQLEQLLSMSKKGFLHLFPLIFKSNGLGLLNMGVSPNLFPGQKWINDIEERKKLETAWKTNLPEQPGLSIDKILEKTFTEDIRVIYLMGDIPESIEHDDTVKRSLSKAELLVVQSPYHSRLFSDAEVILPPLTIEESEGTITNIEGRISPLSVPVSMRGQNKHGREIIAQISTLMGYPMPLSNLDEINKEIN